MKFTETYFKLPTRVYDAIDLKEALREENTGKEIGHVPYRIGGETLIHHDIKGWKAMRFRELPDEDGFPCTIVKMKDGEDILCQWPIKKFEIELEAYASKYEEWIAQEQEKVVEDIATKIKNSAETKEVEKFSA